MVDTKSATGKLILTIFGGFAQFERDMMLERKRERIAKAKAENRYLGRKPSARLKAEEAVRLHREGKTVTEVAKTLGIARFSNRTAQICDYRAGTLESRHPCRSRGRRSEAPESTDLPL